MKHIFLLGVLLASFPMYAMEDDPLQAGWFDVKEQYNLTLQEISPKELVTIVHNKKWHEIPKKDTLKKILSTQDNNGDTLVHHLVSDNQAQLISHCLQAGFDTTLCNRNKVSCLLLATQMKKRNIINVIVSHEAKLYPKPHSSSIHLKDIVKKDALSHALLEWKEDKEEWQSICQALLEHPGIYENKLHKYAIPVYREFVYGDQHENNDTA